MTQATYLTAVIRRQFGIAWRDAAREAIAAKRPYSILR